MKKLICTFGLLVVGQLSGRAGWHEMLSNNGFEIQSAYWNAYALPGGDPMSAGIVNLGNAHTGSWYGYVGDYSTSHHSATGAVTQLVGIPPGATTVTLSFYLNVTSQETTTTSMYDTLGAYLRTYPGDVAVITLHQWSNLNKDPNGIPNNYVLQSFSSSLGGYNGQEMTFQFYGQTDSSLSTTFRIDDVSLQAYVPDYTISASAGANGSISPNGSFSAEYGQTVSFTATPAQNYTVDSWYVNGNLQAVGSTTLQLGVSGNATMYVTFKPVTYTVAISAGQNGTVNPSGNVSVNAGNDLNLTATPAANYAVDTWYTNGTAAQTGGNTFKWESIKQNGSVSVTFAANYTLTISTNHGVVLVSMGQTGPAKANYASGAQLILTPVPDAGWAFAGWSGDISGSAQPYVLLMNGNKSVTPNFVSQVSPTAMSTPTVSFPPNTPGSQCSFSIPTKEGWKYSIKVYRNGPVDWKYLTTFIGSGFNTVVTDTHPAGPLGNYYTWSAEPYSDSGSFLHFPITNDSASAISPYDAEIRAIFDNDGSPDVPDGHILLFTGQSLVFGPGKALQVDDAGNVAPCYDYKQPNVHIGYKQDAQGTDVTMPLTHYQSEDGTSGQKGTIWYDGHTGYDYAYGTASHVIAAADGVVDGESNPAQYNQIVIRHSNGYKTYYLHLNDWDPAIVIGAHVWAGQPIGHPGNSGLNGERSGPIHLHFTVKKQGTDGNYRQVDPYGLQAEDATYVYPILWVTQPP